MNRPEARPPSRLSAPRREKSTASLADGARLAAAARRVDRALHEWPFSSTSDTGNEIQIPRKNTFDVDTVTGDLFSDPLAYK